MKMKCQTLLVMLLKKGGWVFRGLGRWECYSRVRLAHLIPKCIPKRVQKTLPSLEVASRGSSLEAGSVVGMTADKLACLISVMMMGFRGGTTHQRQEMYE